MNTTSNGQSFESPMPLPPQNSEQGINNVANTSANLGSPEQPTLAADQAPMPQLTPPIPMPPIQDAAASAQTARTSSTDVSPTTIPSVSSLLDDSDLIEKEWVNKAKKIVDDNRDDPFKQSEELTVVKVDYMKTHYDKNIKLK